MSSNYNIVQAIFYICAQCSEAEVVENKQELCNQNATVHMKLSTDFNRSLNARPIKNTITCSLLLSMNASNHLIQQNIRCLTDPFILQPSNS